MPYLRPDRKGLPDPLSEDGENSVEMPRSESYLHLSDLADASTSSQVDAVGPSQSVSQLIDTGPGPRESKKIRAFTPPDDTSQEDSPPKESMPSSPTSENMEKLRAMDPPKPPSRRSSKINFPPSLSPQDISCESPPQTKDSGGQSPEPKLYRSPEVDPWVDNGKETMLEISKRLKEQNVKDVELETHERQSRPNVPGAITSGPPLKSTKESKASLEKQLSPQFPILSPKSPSSHPNLDAKLPQLPKKLPRHTKKSIEEKEMDEIPVEMRPHCSPLISLAKSQTEGDVDSPAPTSANTSENSSKVASEPLVVMPVTLSNPPTPVYSLGIPKEKSKVDNRAGEQRVEAKSEVKPQSTTRRPSPTPARRMDRKEVVTDTFKRESMLQSARSVPTPAPAFVAPARRDSRPVTTSPILAPPSGSQIPAPANIKRMTSNRGPVSSYPVAPAMSPQSDSRLASKQFTTPIPNKHRSIAISQQSASAHMAVRQGDVLQTVCYGPVQFADIAEAFNESAVGRTVLDYPLLKRLDEAIFFRVDNQRDTIQDGTVRSFIVTSETRLLLVVQQFMITAALLPAHKRVFGGDIEPDPLIKFVDDVEALIQYMIDDLHNQQDIFAPSTMDLLAFVEQRCMLAQTSQEPSFYFRHEISDITMKYVQGLCETICGLWPNGKFFIGAEGFNPRDSLTPAHFHRQRSTEIDIVASQFDKYFYDPGLLGHVVASDYRQFFRGAFPFLMDIGRQLDKNVRSDRERDMCVDAWFVERGVFKFERTTFVREHLLVDQARRVRIYVDDFDGTRYLVYFNHRIGRLLGLSHLGFEILQTYNLLFLSNWRSRRIAQGLGINISSLEQFDSIFIHQKLFDAPRVNEFLLFRDRLCLFQRRLATFRPERWGDIFKGGYAEPIWCGVVWFMIAIVMLVLASIIATVLVNVLVR